VTSIRPLERGDIPGVARLFALVWRKDADAADDELERFFASTLLDHPWVDPELPSLVAIDGDEIVGLIGSNVRRAVFDDVPVRIVCSAHLISHPRVRGEAVGARLMKSLLGGAQDLTFTDGATDEVRRMWEAFGGSVVPLGTLAFVRLFRPASLGADVVLARRGRRIAASPLRAAARAVDRAAVLAARRRLVPTHPETAVVTALTPDALFEHAPHVLATARLRSTYDTEYTTWLFDELHRVEARGTLWADGIPRGHLWAELVHQDGIVKGWYVCHHREGGFCRILQLAAAPRAVEQIFALLSFRARLFGAAGLYGRLEPTLVEPVTNAGCVIRPSDGRLLVHSRRAELASAVRAGDAFLTRMDGEWW
jgi:hypothetical protein